MRFRRTDDRKTMEGDSSNENRVGCRNIWFSGNDSHASERNGRGPVDGNSLRQSSIILTMTPGKSSIVESAWIDKDPLEKCNLGFARGSEGAEAN